MNQLTTQPTDAPHTKDRVYGGIIGTIGYILSPLSFWNDMFVNIPLAYVFALAVTIFYKPAFLVAFVGGYWATNVIGLIMMHHGVVTGITGKRAPISRKKIIIDLLWSLLYTLGIVALVMSGYLEAPESITSLFHQ